MVYLIHFLFLSVLCGIEKKKVYMLCHPYNWISFRVTPHHLLFIHWYIRIALFFCFVYNRTPGKNFLCSEVFSFKFRFHPHQSLSSKQIQKSVFFYSTYQWHLTQLVSAFWNDLFIWPLVYSFLGIFLPCCFLLLSFFWCFSSSSWLLNTGTI